MPSQAVRQAPVEPGRQNSTVALASPPRQRLCTVELPISCQLSWRNSSPKPSMRLSSSTETASGVESRPVKPVPPVVSTTWISGSAIQAATTARMR